jgi:FkbM family methyltransferase
MQQHPIFSGFSPYKGLCRQGEVIDFVGVRILGRWIGSAGASETVSLTVSPPDAAGDDYFEWISTLEAVAEAVNKFTMFELGAGYGRWALRGGVAAKSRNLQVQLLCVEAEPQHAKWLREALQLNGLFDCARVEECVINTGQELVPFRIPVPELDAATWYGESVGHSEGLVGTNETYFGKKVFVSPQGYNEIYIPAVPLKKFLQGYPLVNFLNMDVQGAEGGIVRDSIHCMNQKVRRVHIGTHSHDIDTELVRIFQDNGWLPLWCFGSLQTNDTPFGRFEFVDGVQAWLNPRVIV